MPYFKGVTRNTALKITGFFEKHQPCLNQILIKQGDRIKDPVIIIIHKGEFRVTKKVQNDALSRPTSQNRLVYGNMVEKRPPSLELDLGILSKGCFVGLEDKVYGNKFYSISVECLATKGTIYVING